MKVLTNVSFFITHFLLGFFSFRPMLVSIVKPLIITDTKSRSKLIRKCTLIRSGFFHSFFKFVTHLTPLNIAFTLILAVPIYSWSTEFLSTTNYIECKTGYAIEVSPGHYVTCDAIDLYWSAEFTGKRLVQLEMQDPANLNPTKTKELK